jgi:hypothetical protein
MQLELRAQRHLVDEAGGGLDWEVMDPGEPGTPRRECFDLACKYGEPEIWQQAERAGLTAALGEFLGRGPLTAAEFSVAQAEWRRRFDPRPAADVAVAELRQFVLDAATAAGEPCPPWADRLDTLPAEEAIAVNAWLDAHEPAVEPGVEPPVEPVAVLVEQEPTN